METAEGHHSLLDSHGRSHREVGPVPGCREQAVCAQTRDGLTDCDPRGGLGERHPCGFGDERNSAGCARIGLQHVESVAGERELDVEQTPHTDTFGDSAGAGADLLDLLVPECHRRQRACGVAGVDTGLFDVLHDPAEVQILPVEQGIDVDLDGFVEELVDEHGVLGAGLGGPLDVVGQYGFVVHDLHAPATEDVRGPDQDRIPDLRGDRPGLLGATGKAVPWHRQARRVQHLSERPALLGQVDRLRSRSQQGHTLGLQAGRETQRCLATELADHAGHRPDRLLRRDHLEHVLEGQRFEIQAVGGVVVGRDGLGVAVDHDRLVPRLPQSQGGMHAGVVELDPLADAVRTRAQDDHSLLVPRLDLGLGVVAGVVVRRVGGELGGTGVDGLEHRTDAQRVPHATDHVLPTAPQGRDLYVGEAGLLGPPQQCGREAIGPTKTIGHGIDPDDLLQEPGIDRGDLVDLFDGGAEPQRLLHLLQTAVVRASDLIEQLVEGTRVLRPAELRTLLLDAAQGLLQCLREVASERHGLPDALHRGGQGVVRAGELLEREPRDLHHDVVESRFERRRCLPRDVVGDLVEGVPDGQLRCDLGDGESGGFRGERRTSRDPRVHLDDDDPAVLGVQRELDVAAPGVDPDLPDHGDPDITHPLVLAVCERESRRNRDRVTGMNTERIEVLDRADHHDVVVAVAHEFEFELLPAQDRLLEQDLCGGAGRQPGSGDAAQVLLVVGHPGPGTAHGERRPHHDRVAEVVDSGQALIKAVADRRTCRLGADLVHDLLEQFAVLPTLDGVDIRADEFNAVPLEHAVLCQCDGRVQRRLPSQGRQERVRPFLVDHFLDELRGDRLDVRGVGELGVRHDGRRVAVDQDHPQALCLEDTAGLCT